MGMSKADIWGLFVFICFSIFVGFFLIPLAEKGQKIQEQNESMRKITVENKMVVAEEGTKKRFKAEFHGEFRGGYEDNPRHIFVITDSVSGVEYLAITGCGTTELRKERQGNLVRVKEE